MPSIFPASALSPLACSKTRRMVIRSISASAVVEREAARCGAQRNGCPGLFGANGWRQIFHVNDFMIAECYGARNAIFQFAHVSRPFVMQQALHGRRGDLQMPAGGIAIQKVVHKRRNVRTAFAQGRKMHGDDVQAKVQVFAEGARRDRRIPGRGWWRRSREHPH